MTTPAVEFGNLGVRVFAQHPQDHPQEEKRGRLIVRESQCPGTPGRPCQIVISQHGINKNWLEKLSPSQRQGFLEGCEVTAKGAYLPKRCTVCERRMSGP